MHKNKDDGSPSRGLVIATASNAGVYPFPIAPLYAASKAGVINLVRSLGPVLEKSKIQINALAPAVLGMSMVQVYYTLFFQCLLLRLDLETNIAPSPDLFKPMIITPMSTLTKGVAQFVEDPSRTGQVVEIHGESVTLRQPPEFVDEDSRKNLETFWNLGYA